MSNTATPSTTKVAEQLRYIQEEILEQVRLAKALLRNAPTLTRQRAESYWLPQLTMALSKEHDYLGGCMVDMEDTINELEADDQGEQDDAS